MHPPTMAPAYFRQSIQPDPPIRIILENVFPALAAGHHMINGASRLVA
ncbi:hypothetical protein Hsar01_04122 [Haloferula sargassicola]|uniref:Uncharacterized protein n=1 Tax=Haloferula sargassicola TaxID=490096 RepID=A0ABP9UTM9_9BACT